MVSKASELLPEPETPVTTVNWLWGISSETFLRLWTRAPRMRIVSSKGYVGSRLLPAVCFYYPRNQKKTPEAAPSEFLLRAASGVLTQEEGLKLG